MNRLFMRGFFNVSGTRSPSRAAACFLQALALFVAGFLGFNSASAGDEDFYDAEVLRTIEITFPSNNFWSQLEQVSLVDDQYLTGDMTVDGIVYEGVGVRWRGNTSQRNAGEKRSFKIAVDHTDSSLDVYGYQTVKLNNAAGDPSFLREALYSQTCKKYGPAPTANHVKLVLNGQNWGVYVNVQQFNKDFLDQWYDSTKGNRWKANSGRGTGGGNNGGGGRPPRPPRPPRPAQNVQPVAVPAGGVIQPDGAGAGQGLPPLGSCGGGGFLTRGDGALTWLGANQGPYQNSYELKSDDQENPWTALVDFCDAFNNSSDAEFENLVHDILDVDATLWQIALENAFADDDGYIHKGLDYTIYQDLSYGRFHTIQHDGNETFRCIDGWRVLPEIDNPNRPVLVRLMAIPRLRARYVAHLRTLIEESFNWEAMEQMATDMHNLIAEEVELDTKKLFSTNAFYSNLENASGNVPGIRQFVIERRDFLLAHPELQEDAPNILSVELQLAPDGNGGFYPPVAGAEVGIVVEVEAGPFVESVTVYHAGIPDAPFDSVELHDDGNHDDGAAGDGVYGGAVPSYPAGTEVRYYVEVYADGVMSFQPPRTELGADSYIVDMELAQFSPVVINELMPLNEATIADPQGELDDWVELHNKTAAAVDLSGMYLSDKEGNPRKWQFPEGTSIEGGGYLVVWLDEDGSDDPGLHANFKLTSEGEMLMLVDSDERDNQLLDKTVYGEMEPDRSWGRYPNATGDFDVLQPTPGESNGGGGPAPDVFTRGDANDDGNVDISDAIKLLTYLFTGGEAPGCLDSGDTNDDGDLNITDSIFLLNYLFTGNLELPMPVSLCGEDPTADQLDCGAYNTCN